MLKRWIFALFTPVLLLAEQISSTRELASLQPEPSALINGCFTPSREILSLSRQT